MKLSHARTATILAGLALSLSATQAWAAWQWVEDEPTPSTYIYDEPRGPGYYQQRPRTYVQEETYVEPVAPVVTNSEVFRDGRCDVTRTYLSDGTSTDDRVCTKARLVLPHELVIDRIGRHFDRLRGYDD